VRQPSSFCESGLDDQQTQPRGPFFEQLHRLFAVSLFAVLQTLSSQKVLRPAESEAIMTAVDGRRILSTLGSGFRLATLDGF
jgi:hypothetical protein